MAEEKFNKHWPIVIALLFTCAVSMMMFGANIRFGDNAAASIYIILMFPSGGIGLTMLFDEGEDDCGV